MMTYYLDMSDALEAAGDAELRQRLRAYRGETVYRLSWWEGEQAREGFASAASARDARAIARAHEAGYGRPVTQVRASRWGTRDRLAAWARRRSSC